MPLESLLIQSSTLKIWFSSTDSQTKITVSETTELFSGNKIDVAGPLVSKSLSDFHIQTKLRYKKGYLFH